MPTIRTRAAKASALTQNELDNNFKRTVTQKTTTYQVLISDNRSVIEGNHATTAFTITLPPVATAAAAETGDFEVTITNINEAIVTVEGSGSETIDGNLNLALERWASATFALDSAQTGWKITSLRPSSVVTLEGTSNTLWLKETDYNADEQIYRIIQSNGGMFFQTYDDALTGTNLTNWLAVSRTGAGTDVTKLLWKAQTHDFHAGAFPYALAFNIDINGDATFAARAISSAGNDIDSGLFAFKANNQTVTSSTTLQNDNSLFLTLAASTTYRIEMMFVAQSASADPDLSYQFIEPDGTFTAMITKIENNNSTTLLANGVTQATGNYTTSLAAGVPVMHKADITATTGGSGGVFRLQWAQLFSSGTATQVNAGAWMKATRLNG